MKKTEIVAEIAQGYEGRPLQTELLAKGAVNAGADAVKFQLVYADELATSDYQYYDLFRSLEMQNEAWERVAKIVHGAGRKLYFDVFGRESLDVALRLGADGIKLSTTEFYNDDLVSKTLSRAKNVMISIGGIPIPDVKDFIERHALKPSETTTFMYGFQAEPTPLDNNHLGRLSGLRKTFEGFRFGFMDHSEGGEAEDATILPLMALGAGVDLIEKHLTLDYALQLEDFVSALSPTRFADFVRLVRKFEVAMGKPQLELTDLERQYANKATKIAVALRDIASGREIGSDDVALKRIGGTHKPTTTHRRLADVLGKKTTRSILKDEPISDNISGV